MDLDKPSIASLLGADVFVPLRHESATKQLTAILNQQSSLSFPDKVEHDLYLRFREQLAKSSTLAAIAGDSRLESYVTQWTELQKRYARQVIDGVTSGLKEQKDLLEACDQELTQGEVVRKQYEILGNKKFLELSDTEIQELQALKKKVDILDGTAKEREQLYRAVSGVSRVEQTLTTLIQSGHESIHYVIPSVKEAQQKLGENAYDGPLFEPFSVSNRVDVRDIFLRQVASPHTILQKTESRREVRVEDVPSVLSELIQAYQHITEQVPGTVINPRQVSEKLNLQKVGVKGLGGYLDDNATIFGVQKRDAAGSRTFIRKESGNVLERNAFITYMLDGKLQQHDTKEVNEFYLQKTLGLLRETPEAYIGFTKERVHAMAEKQGLPVGRIYISRNLKNTDGVSLKNEETEEYVFSQIIPTPTQVRYTQDAMKHFGINRFTPKELIGKIRKLNPTYSMSPRVMEKVLEDNCADWGLKVVSNDPLKYQREDRSVPSASTKKVETTDRLM